VRLLELGVVSLTLAWPRLVRSRGYKPLRITLMRAWEQFIPIELRGWLMTIHWFDC
jgi:hypothetical protein